MAAHAPLPGLAGDWGGDLPWVALRPPAADFAPPAATSRRSAGAGSFGRLSRWWGGLLSTDPPNPPLVRGGSSAPGWSGLFLGTVGGRALFVCRCALGSPRGLQARGSLLMCPRWRGYGTRVRRGRVGGIGRGIEGRPRGDKPRQGGDRTNSRKNSECRMANNELGGKTRGERD